MRGDHDGRLVEHHRLGFGGGLMMGGVVSRGVRLGMWIGSATAAIFGSFAFVAAAMWLGEGLPGEAVACLVRGIVFVAGSLGVGVLVGAAVGVALALSPGCLASRAPLRGLLAGSVAGTVYLGEPIVIAVATNNGYGPMLLALLFTPIASAVAAAHSGDILGRTHYHPWLAGERCPKRGSA
ncbi:hypothetical protein ACIRRH_03125 [Kitasatospora sp. NPDC101235]|uniref:hypothetical protein n=1 Tax=Kitasatospora sp. NPDC101235 TaxID=3364101 RepID=UPI003824B51C